MADILQAALEYAAMGFSVFPCKPMSKEPATPNGFRNATTEEEIINFWWRANPRFNLAIATQGLIVIDYDDPNPGNWPKHWVSRMVEPWNGVFYHTPRDGSHTILTQPPGANWRNTTKKLAPNIDTRADGGYVLVPPSETPDGEYRWPQGSEGMFWPPVVPAWFAREMYSLNGIQMPKELLEGARPIPDGQQNSTLASIGGWLRRHGFSEGQILAALLKVSEERCVDGSGNPWPHPEDRVRKIAASVARYEPDLIAIGAMEGVDLEPIEPAKSEYPDPGPFPDELVFAVPGFMEEVIAYTLKTASRQQPVYALAAALALMSVLTGRKLRDHSNLRTNLLNIIVGPSASGKERPRQVNRQILLETGCVDLLGSEEINSGNGVYATMKTKPACLIQLDEIGHMLLRIKGGKNDALANVPVNLMKLYSGSGGLMLLGGYVDTKRNFEINQPHCVLLGTTTLKNFADSLSEDQMADGFIARVLCFISDESPDPLDPVVTQVPASILDEVCRWRDYFKDQGNLMPENPKATTLKYNPDAASLLQEYRIDSNRKKKTGDPIWGRSYEKAKKAAMLIQASKDGPGVSDVELFAVKWGIALSDWSTKKILNLAEQSISTTQLGGETKRVMRWIRKKGRITKNEFTRRFWDIPKRTREEILDTLEASGYTSRDTSRGKTKNIVHIRYRGE